MSIAAATHHFYSVGLYFPANDPFDISWDGVHDLGETLLSGRARPEVSGVSCAAAHSSSQSNIRQRNSQLDECGYGYWYTVRPGGECGDGRGQCRHEERSYATRS